MFMIFMLLRIVLNLLEFLILARVIISWVPVWQRAPWGRVVTALSDPLLLPLRRAMRVDAGGFALDFSPMVALFIIHIARRFLGI